MKNKDIIESVVVNLLGLETVLHDKQLYDYGLNSISFIELIDKVQKEIGVDINLNGVLKDVIKNPTINTLCKCLPDE